MESKSGTLFIFSIFLLALNVLGQEVVPDENPAAATIAPFDYNNGAPSNTENPAVATIAPFDYNIGTPSNTENPAVATIAPFDYNFGTPSNNESDADTFTRAAPGLTPAAPDTETSTSGKTETPESDEVTTSTPEEATTRPATEPPPHPNVSVMRIKGKDIQWWDANEDNFKTAVASAMTDYCKDVSCVENGETVDMVTLAPVVEPDRATRTSSFAPTDAIAREETESEPVTAQPVTGEGDGSSGTDSGVLTKSPDTETKEPKTSTRTVSPTTEAEIPPTTGEGDGNNAPDAVTQEVSTLTASPTTEAEIPPITGEGDRNSVTDGVTVKDSDLTVSAEDTQEPVESQTDIPQTDTEPSVDQPTIPPIVFSEDDVNITYVKEINFTSTARRKRDTLLSGASFQGIEIGYTVSRPTDDVQLPRTVVDGAITTNIEQIANDIDVNAGDMLPIYAPILDITTEPPSRPSEPSAAPVQPSDALEPWVIALIVLACVIGAALIAYIVYRLCCKKGAKRSSEQQYYLGTDQDVHTAETGGAYTNLYKDGPKGDQGTSYKYENPAYDKMENTDDTPDGKERYNKEDATAKKDEEVAEAFEGEIIEQHKL